MLKYRANSSFFNLYKLDLDEKDRLNEEWFGVATDLIDYAHHSKNQPLDAKSKTSKKAVLLMHERAFRKCKDSKKYANEAVKLSILITHLKNKGFTFDTMDNY